MPMELSNQVIVYYKCRTIHNFPHWKYAGRTCKNVDRVFAVNDEDKYSDVFSGKLGTFPGLQHLKVDNDIKPMINIFPLLCDQS